MGTAKPESRRGCSEVRVLSRSRVLPSGASPVCRQGFSLTKRAHGHPSVLAGLGRVDEAVSNDQSASLSRALAQHGDAQALPSVESSGHSFPRVPPQRF